MKLHEKKKKPTCLSNYPNAKIDIKKALKLRYTNNLSLDDIAKHFNCHKSSVHAALSRFEKLLRPNEEIEAFEDHKSKILSNLEWKLIEKMMDEDTIKSASLNNAAYAYQQAATQNRLEKGLATEITDSYAITATLQDIQRREEELLRQIDVKIMESGEQPPEKGGKVGNDCEDKQGM